ncbi:MAG TPA: superoxide dismutase [Sphingomicrobium sp.]|nr:superoxide dismutase [Sphingomicrobium sp.]
MAFELPDLPYPKNALAPHMSAETLEFHHSKHHAAYVKKTNALLEDKQLSGAALTEVVRAASRDGDSTLFNNSAQLWNHSFFWQCLAPAEGQQPSGKLKQMIDDGFGGVEPMLQKLGDEAAGHFSNGWAWLLLDRGALKIASLHDADTPLVHDGMVPLFTLDVWEHAYYIDYRNDRPRFASSVLANIVNWEFVVENLDGRGVDRADQESASVAEGALTA